MDFKVVFPNKKVNNWPFGFLDPNYRMRIFTQERELEYWDFDKNTFDTDIKDDIIVLEFND